MRIVAQDPSFTGGRQRNILTAEIDVPAEALSPGPRGYRVHVVDYDTSASCLYPAFHPGAKAPRWALPDAVPSDDHILGDPRFHAQNVYAIAMRTLARFELALGRRISWGFSSPGHQLKIAPHAFADANAFYSRRDEALLFGYIPARTRGQTVFTCLSHDIVAHEASHALLDGLRNRLMEPSSEDQAAFHEGFADIVALLSTFSLPEVVGPLIDVHLVETAKRGGARRAEIPKDALAKENVDPASLRRSVVLALGKELGQQSASIGRGALRHSVADDELRPSPRLYRSERFAEPHRRGELLVAAVLNAFVEVWAERLQRYLRDRRTGYIDRTAAAEEGARAADYLLTMAIRGLDYCPPIHLTFPSYLSALLTADLVSNPKDQYRFRQHLLESFGAFGIAPASMLGNGKLAPDGTWRALDETRGAPPLTYDRARFESMQRDPEEMFRFAWENRKPLSLVEGAFTRVLSVRPCLRVAPEDGFHVRETVAELLQQVQLSARELAAYGIRVPEDMPRDTVLTLFGGVTLIFDEYGRVKYAIGDRVFDPDRRSTQKRQEERIASLWAHGAIQSAEPVARRFAALHRLRVLDPDRNPSEEW